MFATHQYILEGRRAVPLQSVAFFFQLVLLNKKTEKPNNNFGGGLGENPPILLAS
ncbi:hypothetical protein NIES2107_70470 (plasmid) [Nostoc carneum NIES-2107]|nr:hypothetical protein NIES2107_70470 [Nostoc carneum NIES-2107]